MDGQMTYTLTTPKEIGGEMIAAIPCRELELDEVIELQGLDTNDVVVLKAFLARITGQPETVIGRLTLSDFKGLFEAISGPLGARPGSKPSASAAK